MPYHQRDILRTGGNGSRRQGSPYHGALGTWGSPRSLSHFDNYDMPKDDKIEPRPRHPTHFATWLKQARNEIKMIGSVLGLEHMPGRKEALEQIEKAHEADPEAWPEAYCFSLWEELKAAWVEELRESRRRLCKVLNTDIPRKEDLKFIALAPGSGFHFPTTFQLDDPGGYYQTVCVPRQNRAIKSIIYSQLHVKRAAPGKVGGRFQKDRTRLRRRRPRRQAANAEETRVARIVIRMVALIQQTRS